MSLDIYLSDKELKKCECECSHCGNKHHYETTDLLFHRNITHNLGQMAAECGVYPYIWRHDENGVKKASDLIEPVEKAIAELHSNPEKYKKLEPKNKWGTYTTFFNFLNELYLVCNQYPEAIVEVCK